MRCACSCINASRVLRRPGLERKRPRWPAWRKRPFLWTLRGQREAQGETLAGATDARRRHDVIYRGRRKRRAHVDTFHNDTQTMESVGGRRSLCSIIQLAGRWLRPHLFAARCSSFAMRRTRRWRLAPRPAIFVLGTVATRRRRRRRRASSFFFRDAQTRPNATSRPDKMWARTGPDGQPEMKFDAVACDLKRPTEATCPQRLPALAKHPHSAQSNARSGSQ